MRAALFMLALILLPSLAAAEGIEASPRRFGLGIQAGVLDVPRGHVGAPVQGDESGLHIPFALVVRWRMDERMALNAGVGLPTSSVGLSFWLAHELYTRLVTANNRVVGLDLYEDAGLQLGFAGPDYFARHENEFVGYGYVYSGPLAAGLRLPVGLRATWADGVFDTYLESTPLLMVAPSVEALFDLALGIRFRL